MRASEHPPVVNATPGLYRTYTVGYYMGERDRRIMGSAEEVAPKGGRYARAGCACKILGATRCPVHGLGQGCATPSAITEGRAQFSGGEGPAMGQIAAGTSAVPLAVGAVGISLLGLWLGGAL